MEKIKAIIFFVVLLALSVQLSGCGKVSAPEPYKDSGYPHSYPRR